MKYIVESQEDINYLIIGKLVFDLIKNETNHVQLIKHAKNFMRND